MDHMDDNLISTPDKIKTKVSKGEKQQNMYNSGSPIKLQPSGIFIYPCLNVISISKVSWRLSSLQNSNAMPYR